MHAIQEGHAKAPNAKMRSMARKIDPTAVTHFAETKHKGLPNHKRKKKSASDLSGVGGSAAPSMSPAGGGGPAMPPSSGAGGVFAPRINVGGMGGGFGRFMHNYMPRLPVGPPNPARHPMLPRVQPADANTATGLAQQAHAANAQAKLAAVANDPSVVDAYAAYRLGSLNHTKQSTFGPLLGPTPQLAGQGTVQGSSPPSAPPPPPTGVDPSQQPVPASPGDLAAAGGAAAPAAGGGADPALGYAAPVPSQGDPSVGGDISSGTAASAPGLPGAAQPAPAIPPPDPQAAEVVSGLMADQASPETDPAAMRYQSIVSASDRGDGGDGWSRLFDKAAFLICPNKKAADVDTPAAPATPGTTLAGNAIHNLARFAPAAGNAIAAGGTAVGNKLFGPTQAFKPLPAKAPPVAPPPAWATPPPPRYTASRYALNPPARFVRDALADFSTAPAGTAANNLPPSGLSGGPLSPGVTLPTRRMLETAGEQYAERHRPGAPTSDVAGPAATRWLANPSEGAPNGGILINQRDYPPAARLRDDYAVPGPPFRGRTPMPADRNGLPTDMPPKAGAHKRAYQDNAGPRFTATGEAPHVGASVRDEDYARGRAAWDATSKYFHLAGRDPPPARKAAGFPGKDPSPSPHWADDDFEVGRAASDSSRHFAALRPRDKHPGVLLRLFAPEHHDTVVANLRRPEVRRYYLSRERGDSADSAAPLVQQAKKAAARRTLFKVAALVDVARQLGYTWGSSQQQPQSQPSQSQPPARSPSTATVPARGAAALFKTPAFGGGSLRGQTGQTKTAALSSVRRLARRRPFPPVPATASLLNTERLLRDDELVENAAGGPAKESS